MLLTVFALVTSVACGGSDSPASDTAPSETAPAATQAARPPAKPAKPAEPDFFEGIEADALPFVTGQLPEGYPEDLPPPPDATPAVSMLQPGKGGMVGFTSTASPREIFDHYQEQLVAQGWELGDVGENPFSIASSKGERKAQIKIARTGEQSEVLIMLREN